MTICGDLLRPTTVQGCGKKFYILITYMCLVILKGTRRNIFFKFAYIGTYRPPGGQARFPEAQLGPGGPQEAICDHVRPPAVDFDPQTC